MYLKLESAVRRKTSVRGFSLVEMLVVIAIMAILAGLGIGYLTNLNDNIGETRDRRNAQEIASTAAAATAAGLTSMVVAGDAVQTARNVSLGATATQGSFSGKVFRVPGMSDADVVKAAYYLDINGQSVTYNGGRRLP